MAPLKLRDTLVLLALASAAEAYAILHFAPAYKPRGGLGRLTEWFLLLNSAVLFTYYLFIYPFLLSPLRRIPGPPGGGLITGHLRDQFSRPPARKMLKWVNEIPNDGLLHFRTVFNRDTLLPTSHETLKAVLSDHTYDYEKPTAFVKVLRRILGDGLILVEGNVHKFQRKHLMPSFQLKHIRELYPMFWNKACEMTIRLAPEDDEKSGQTSQWFELEFGQWCMRATLDIIGDAGFGTSFNSLKNPDDELVAQYHSLLEPGKEKLAWFVLSVIFPGWLISSLPWSINRNLARIQNHLETFALKMVRERRTEVAAEEKKPAPNGSATVPVPAVTPDSTSRNDILTLLVRSNDFTDHELSQQFLTMLAAGHETTSSALSWCAYLLALHPEMQTRVRNEVRAALPSPDSGENMKAAQIDSLTWLNSVCFETLRLYPTVPVTSREVVKETQLGGYTVPVGTRISLVPMAINRSRAFWGENAEEFKPERWVNDDGSVNKNGGSSSNYAQMTFLHGPRSCIGQGFAQSELKCLLAAFVGRYEFKLSRDEKEYYPAGLVTTKPAGGMWLHVKAVPGW